MNSNSQFSSQETDQLAYCGVQNLSLLLSSFRDWWECENTTTHHWPQPLATHNLQSSTGNSGHHGPSHHTRQQAISRLHQHSNSFDQAAACDRSSTVSIPWPAAWHYRHQCHPCRGSANSRGSDRCVTVRRRGQLVWVGLQFVRLV